jgi:hypothetical protein
MVSESTLAGISKGVDSKGGYGLSANSNEFCGDCVPDTDPEIRLRIAPMEARTRKVLAVLIVAVALIVLFLMYWAITHATLI